MRRIMASAKQTYRSTISQWRAGPSQIPFPPLEISPEHVLYWTAYRHATKATLHCISGRGELRCRTVLEFGLSCKVMVVGRSKLRV